MDNKCCFPKLGSFYHKDHNLNDRQNQYVARKNIFFFINLCFYDCATKVEPIKLAICLRKQKYFEKIIREEISALSEHINHLLYMVLFFLYRQIFY